MKQLTILLFINKHDMDDLFSISELCKDGWKIIHFDESDQCTTSKHNTKVILIKPQ